MRERRSIVRRARPAVTKANVEAADLETVANRIEEVRSRCKHLVRTPHVWRQKRERPGERDEGIRSNQPFQSAMSLRRRAELSVEFVKGGPIDLEPGVKGSLHHRFKVRTQDPCFVERGKIPKGDEADAQCEQDDCGDCPADEDGAPPAGPAAPPAPPGALLLDGHGAGYAMTMNRGAVGS